MQKGQEHHGPRVNTNSALVRCALSFLPWQFLTLSRSRGLLNNSYLPAKSQPTVCVFHFTDAGEVRLNSGVGRVCFMEEGIRFQTLLLRPPLWSWQPVHNKEHGIYSLLLTVAASDKINKPCHMDTLFPPYLRPEMACWCGAHICGRTRPWKAVSAG